MPRVLIAAERDIVTVLSTVMSVRTSLDVDAAINAPAVMKKLESDDYAVVVIDVTAPALLALDVIAKLKGNPDPPSIVAIRGKEVAHYELDPELVTIVLRKPLDVEMCVNVVKALVEARKVSRDRGSRGTNSGKDVRIN